MRGFFAELHYAIAAGGQDRRATRKTSPDGRAKCMTIRCHYFSLTLIRPQRLAIMEDRLQQAEKLAVSEKVRRRLKLVRAEFDALQSTLTVIQFYNAFRMRPDEMSREGLLRAIDERNTLLDSLYITRTSGGRTTYGGMKPIPGWPEVLPFSGHGRDRVGLTQDQNAARFKDSVFTWNTSAVRQTPLPSPKSPRTRTMDT